MPKIFISYRREDTGPQAGRLRTSLVHHFGEEQVFRDKESIRPGVNWRDVLRETLSGDTVVLALIGKTWITATDASGQRLLENSENNNRLEIEAAARLKLKTIPVLIDDAKLPREQDLPESMRELLTINALRLRDDDWDADARTLVETLESHGVRSSSGQSEPRSGWLSNPLAWLAAVAVAAVAVVSYMKSTATPPPSTPSPAPAVASPPVDTGPSFQVIIDRSEAMSAPFAGTTKLEAAKKTLVQVLQETTADTDNLSLREFGGQCNDPDNTRRVLDFDRGEARVTKAVDALTTIAGDPTLVNAVVEATGDFSGRSGRKSGIIVISGGDDRCGHADPAGAIRARLQRYPELTFDLRFIGVALSAPAASALSSLAQKAGGTFRNARTASELDDAVRHALIIEARVGEVEVATGILGQGMNHLNAAVSRHLGSQPDYAAADREVREAEQALERAAVPPTEPRQPEGVRNLLDLARQAVDVQRKLLGATKSLIAAKKSGDSAAASRATDAYNSAATAYVEKVDQIDRLRLELLK